MTGSTKTVRYGSQASLKVGVTGPTSGKVDLYATTSSQTKQLVATGTVAAGAATFTVTPTENTTYSAQLEQGSGYASSTSGGVSVSVAPILSLSTRADGTGRHLGRRVRKVLFTAGIKPARTNETLKFIVQRRVHKHWHTDITQEFPLQGAGAVQVIFYTNRHGLFRLQTSYLGDAAYTASKSPWKKFKVKRLG